MIRFKYLMLLQSQSDGLLIFNTESYMYRVTFTTTGISIIVKKVVHLLKATIVTFQNSKDFLEGTLTSLCVEEQQQLLKLLSLAETAATDAAFCSGTHNNIESEKYVADTKSENILRNRIGKGIKESLRRFNDRLFNGSLKLNRNQHKNFSGCASTESETATVLEFKSSEQPNKLLRKNIYSSRPEVHRPERVEYIAGPLFPDQHSFQYEHCGHKLARFPLEEGVVSANDLALQTVANSITKNSDASAEVNKMFFYQNLFQISYVNSQRDFYIILKSEEPLLLALEDDMRNCYEYRKHFRRKVKIGDSCVVYAGKGRMRRGFVEEASREEVRVFLVDRSYALKLKEHSIRLFKKVCSLPRRETYPYEVSLHDQSLRRHHAFLS
uniref:Tudor domain-containing protein n=1 Tax=Syphacia muris TaxID=451379 RepID=A0A0N5AE28_9BILA